MLILIFSFQFRNHLGQTDRWTGKSCNAAYLYSRRNCIVSTQSLLMLSNIVCAIDNRQWKLFNWWSAESFGRCTPGRQRVRHRSHRPHLHRCW